jgi:hypothetical protein
MSPIPLQLTPYVGLLILDTENLLSYLGQTDTSGNFIQTLMMFDTSPSGGYDAQRVTDAYNYFRARQDALNRPTITIYGFWAYPSGTAIPVLHVVRA